MASGTVLFIPSNGVNIIPAGHTIPGNFSQATGLLQHVGLPFESPHDQPLLNHQVGLREKLHKVEIKTLGAVQIIIGLIHIGFGGISCVVHEWTFISFATVSGYPFWGGLFFIASGALSVSAEKRQNISLVKKSMGMNITSAVMALIGTCLYLTDLAINPLYRYHFSNESTLPRSVGLGLGVLLLLFSSLEFCITIWTAHFGCQATSPNSDMGMMVVPYSISVGGVIPPGACPSPPPPYDFVVSAPK